jgi:putative transposase
MSLNRKKNHHYNTPGHAHGLTFCCFRHDDYFADPVACDLFVEVLNESRKVYRYSLWAYVVMPDHVHLLIWPNDANYDIAKIDSGIKGIASKRYRAYLRENDRDRYCRFIVISRGKETFRFWQPGGGYDRNLWNTGPVYRVIRYIETNPVKAGIVDSPEKYRWSSAWARMTGEGAVPDPVRDCL